MTIDKYILEDGQDTYYVRDAGQLVAKLKIGQQWIRDDGSVYQLRSITWHTGYVSVYRLINGEPDTWHCWYVDTLVKLTQFSSLFVPRKR